MAAIRIYTVISIFKRAEALVIFIVIHIYFPHFTQNLLLIIKQMPFFFGNRETILKKLHFFFQIITQ